MTFVETAIARLFTLVAIVLACAFGAEEIYILLGTLGHTVVDYLVIGLFIGCFGWVTYGAATAVVGLYGMVFRRHMRPGAPGPLPKTALCMPIYHESPASVCAHVLCMAEDLVAHGAGEAFDVFLLSDSTRAEAWLAEEKAWAELVRKLDGRVRVFYRKRGDNVAKKAGNLRDFCMRFGSAYKYMIVLDADSVMSGAVMCELVRRMESQPKTGLIQVPPAPVRRQTPFARLQQFAAAVYGPLWARGSAILWNGDGNYFGHNAIARTEVFLKACGLAPLPGRGAFSGLIMSHDFVEAALVRRAGYEVRLADDLGESYEACPTTLIDYAIRDRRWCQGNIQHLRVAWAPGLHWSSRFHLLHGAMSYLAAPMWLAFVLLGLLAAQNDAAVDVEYFPPYRTLFPQWPVYDYAAAYALLGLSIAVLFGPRILALLVFLVRHWPGWRGAVATVASTLVEFVMSTLLSPALMLFQTVFVLTTIFGEKVAWAAQARGDRRVSFKEAFMRHGVHVFAACALALMGYLVSDNTLLWQLPLVVGLLLSPFLTVVTSSALLGRLLAFWGLLLGPEDRKQHPVLDALDRHEAAREDETIIPHEAFADKELMRVHAQVVALTGMAQPLDDAERERLLALCASGKAPTNAEMVALLRDPQAILQAL